MATNEKQYSKSIFIHETAIVDEPANIGLGTKIWHFSHIMPSVKIGKDCVVGQNCYISSRAVLGNNVKLQNNVSVYDLVELEDNVFVGPSAVFTNDINPRSAFPKGGEWVPTIVKEHATIGANATIICGITIGKAAFIGAGALVNKDVPDFAIVIGMPARIIGWMCSCGKKLRFYSNIAQCECGKKYLKKKLVENKPPEFTDGFFAG